MAQQDKKQQAKLLTEIMEADAKDGLYETTISKKETVQTALEWLHDKWGNCKEWKWEEIEQWFKQAKQMEKQQIMTAWLSSDSDSMYEPKQLKEQAEQYYNETYNK